MGLASFAPIVCTVVVIACAGSAVSDALTADPWLGNELSPLRLPIGWLATASSLMMVGWLILDTREPARSWAKGALALLLVGVMIWSAVVEPSFWDSLGLDDCVVDCVREHHITARGDVIQGKWVIAATNVSATCCALIAIFHRSRHAA